MQRTARGLTLQFILFLTLFTALCSFFSMLSARTAAAVVNDDEGLTVVLDAGHGGEDGGAVSASGLYEKELNLSIAELLRSELEARGVKVIMTRTTDVLLYDRNVDYRGRKKALDLAARRKIAEENPNAVFVSIHMNAYPQTQYKGLQVWFSPNDARSRPLAESIQSTVREQLQPENDRAIKSATSSIYLLHHITTPAVLVECGFLSNSAEAALLASPDYQKQLAVLLADAIIAASEAD